MWGSQFDWLASQPSGWVLRDYHSPNLVLRDGRTGLDRLGILDFQDALLGHPAYDLVSLLQDARLDLPLDLEQRSCSPITASKLRRMNRNSTNWPFCAPIVSSALSATPILGIFARLAGRDGKRAYLQHMPRVARYLENDLKHGDLAALKSWYDRELPGDIAGLTARF